MPILTVILTTYKDFHIFLDLNSERLRILCEQDAIELIIIDDGQEMQQAWSNFKDLMGGKCLNFVGMCTLKNNKQGAARNLGMEHARGKYIWFIDADDQADFEGAFRSAVNGSADVISNNFLYCLSDRNVLKTNGSKSFELKDFIILLATNSMAASCWPYLYRLDYLRANNIIFPEGLYFEDLIFNVSTALVGCGSLCHSGITIYTHIPRRDSASSTKTISRKLMRISQSLKAGEMIVRRRKSVKSVLLAITYFLYHGIWA